MKVELCCLFAVVYYVTRLIKILYADVAGKYWLVGIGCRFF